MKISQLAIIALLIVAAGLILLNNSGIGDQATPSNQAESDAVYSEDSIKGDPDAPVTIIEYSDYECPFCERFYRETLPIIEEQYIEKGIAKLIYKDFPLDSHPHAQKAAEAAECAGEQDSYYAMHDMLFEQGVAGGINSYKQYAVALALDTEAFNQCLDSGMMASEVLEDKDQGIAQGITGTPGFLINGRKISGAQPFSVFSQAIEDAS